MTLLQMKDIVEGTSWVCHDLPYTVIEILEDEGHSVGYRSTHWATGTSSKVQKDVMFRHLRGRYSRLETLPEEDLWE